MLALILPVPTVQVYPFGQYVSTPGGMASFQCLSVHGNITSIQWLVNGTHVEDLNLSNVTTAFDSGIGKLSFHYVPVEYNATRITCEANISSMGTGLIIGTQEAHLLVQG